MLSNPSRANLASSTSPSTARGSSSSAAGTPRRPPRPLAPEPGATAAEALAWVRSAGPVGAPSSTSRCATAAHPAGRRRRVHHAVGHQLHDRRQTRRRPGLPGQPHRPRRHSRRTSTASGRGLRWTTSSTAVVIGSAHGDPGRFALGQGVPRRIGRCRSRNCCRTDSTARWPAPISPIRPRCAYSDAGIGNWLHQLPVPAAGVGIQYSC